MRKKYYIALLALLSSVTGLAVTRTDTISSMTMRDDMVEITYDLRYDNGRVVVDFKNARAIIKGSNRKYNNVKILFCDGINVNRSEREVTINSELKRKGNRLDSFTISEGVDYVDESSSRNDELFIINDNGNKPLLSFEVNGNNRLLEIPIYLSSYKHRDEKGVWKIKKKQKTTYEIFDQCGPLTINLSEALRMKPASSNNSATTQQASTQTTVQESIEILDGGSSDDGSEYELPDMDLAGGGGDGAGAGGGDMAADGQQDGDQQQADAANTDSANEQAEKDRKQHWWMFIIAAILGVLGFGGNQVAQHMRNTRNQRNMMDMQQNVVQRAENEAKRRAQSYARNKTHQAVNQARSKGRQAVRSNVSKLGNSVKDRQAKVNDHPETAAKNTGEQTAAGGKRALIGKKFNKNNKKGGISI